MILALTGQKGGSGKSTTAISVAAELHARGSRVLLVDAAPQGSALTWAAVAAEAGQGAPTVVGMGVDLCEPTQLPTLAKNFEHVVIDCPPRNYDIQWAALMVADLAVLPCGPAAVDVWAMAESLELVRSAQKVRQEQRPELRAAVLLTQLVARTVIGARVREALAEVGLPILSATLGFRIAYQEAPAAGVGVAQYGAGDAADEVHALTDEVLAMGAGRKPRRASRGR